ncbi:uncharacterized protein [Dysidea avara]|uniref:uncharacterized protein n=1 Tax=Dysidea avara TaxID=196820 RepID=UPI00331E41D3
MATPQLDDQTSDQTDCGMKRVQFYAVLVEDFQPVKPLMKVAPSKLQQGVPMYPPTTGPIEIANESARMHIQEAYTSQSTQALIEVVEKNGIHQLSLAGSGYNINATWFKEYCDVKRENGVPVATLYKYESEKYPGHFIRWYHDGSQSGNDTIDCEPKVADPKENYFEWIVESSSDSNDGGFQYKWLKAPVFGVYDDNDNNYPSYYMAFKDEKPIITASTAYGERKFLITPIS